MARAGLEVRKFHPLSSSTAAGVPPAACAQSSHFRPCRRCFSWLTRRNGVGFKAAGGTRFIRCSHPVRAVGGSVPGVFVLFASGGLSAVFALFAGTPSV